MISKEKLRIVFMGTPDFAVESLKKLVENKYNVVGVVTVADKKAGRGQKIRTSPVKDFAVKNNIPVLQPEKLKDETFLKELKTLNADLQIIVAFRMLPEVVWNMPKLGSFNLHGSLLPQYRGAAPINWAVINGDKETGVTTFFLQHEIDTGNIIDQKTLPISENDNAGIVHDKMMVLGADLVLETVVKICNGTAETKPQSEYFKDDVTLNPAPKIFKDDCKIDWSEPIKNVYNKIRGLSPYPAAWTELTHTDGTTTTLKIFDTKIIESENSIGEITSDGKQTIIINGNGGALSIKSLQISGKKRMNTKEFLNGFKTIQDYKVK